MLRNHLYYFVKPLLPIRVRLALRRWHARRALRRAGDTWPILPGSERPPEGWPGWPQGKQFAMVLTHDVEGLLGGKLYVEADPFKAASTILGVINDKRRGLGLLT